MNLKVCGHRVMVRIDNAEIEKSLKPGERIEGGYIVSASGIRLEKIDMKQEKRGADSGTVVQVGELAYKDFGGEPWCKVGDRVFFVRYEGREIKGDEIGEGDGVSFRVLNDDDVIAALPQ